jgi:hypothetical protein
MKRFASFSLLILLCALILTTSTAQDTAAKGGPEANFATGGAGWGTTREEVLDNRNNRKRQLKNLTNDMRKKLADHSAGEITLEPKEKEDMARRMDLYQRKLDMLKEDLNDHVGWRCIAVSHSHAIFMYNIPILMVLFLIRRILTELLPVTKPMRNDEVTDEKRLGLRSIVSCKNDLLVLEIEYSESGCIGCPSKE